MNNTQTQEEIREQIAAIQARLNSDHRVFGVNSRVPKCRDIVISKMIRLQLLVKPIRPSRSQFVGVLLRNIESLANDGPGLARYLGRIHAAVCLSRFERAQLNLCLQIQGVNADFVEIAGGA